MSNNNNKKKKKKKKKPRRMTRVRRHMWQVSHAAASDIQKVVRGRQVRLVQWGPEGGFHGRSEGMVGVTDQMLARAVDELVGRLVAGRDIDDSVNLQAEEEEGDEEGRSHGEADGGDVDSEMGPDESKIGGEDPKKKEGEETEGVSADAVAVLEHAATVIQAGARGMMVRSGVSQMHDTALERVVDSFVEEHLSGEVAPGN